MTRTLSIITATLALLLLCSASAYAAAGGRISDLPIITSPSTNSFIELSDMNQPVYKSRKFLFTNLVLQSQLGSAGIATSGGNATNLTVQGLVASSYIQTSPQTISATDIDVSTGSLFSKTLTADTTFTFSGLTNGARWTVILTQGASWTADFTGVTWLAGETPVMDTGVGIVNVFGFLRSGGVTFGDVSQRALGPATGIIGTFAAPQTDNPYTLTGSNAYGFTLFYGATGTITLPAGVAGMNGVIYNTGSFTITIDPDGTEIVVRDGTAQAGGVSFTLSSGAGNYVYVVFDGTRWVTLAYKGTLGEGT
jgi:hypothetical protein